MRRMPADSKPEPGEKGQKTAVVRSLQVKLIMILVLLVVTVTTVIGIYLLNNVGTYYEERFYNEMGDVFTSDFLDIFRELVGGENGTSRAVEYVQAYSLPLGLDSSRTFSLLDGHTGAYLGGSGTETTVEKTDNILAALSGSVGMETGMRSDCFDIAVPIQAGDDAYIIYIRDTRENVAELHQMLLSAILQAVAFGLIISVMLSVMLAKTISRPIETLTHSAKLVAAGDFSSKPPADSNDEIGVLTRTFNDMSQALSDTLDAVENERNKLSAVFQHMTDGIVALNRRGDVLHINAAARSLLGLPADETEQPDYETLTAPLDMAPESILTLENGQSLERVCRYGGKDLRFFFTPFGSGEHEGGIIIVIYDITEQERLNQARREFVADISHELRTPLTNIRSYAETILADQEMEPAYRERFMQVILNETDRMTRLVRDLLTISKLDYGRMDWNLTQFDPETLLNNTVDAMAMEARKRQLTLTLSVDGPLPVLTADQDRLGQVIANIVSNSIKYTPEGGSIQVTAAPERGGVTMVVRDTGIGIPESDLPHIFERFYRVDKARSREKGGSGLGLAIAKEFIDNLHGTIRIESASNQGTAVTVWLPGETNGVV